MQVSVVPASKNKLGSTNTDSKRAPAMHASVKLKEIQRMDDDLETVEQKRKRLQNSTVYNQPVKNHSNFLCIQSSNLRPAQVRPAKLDQFEPNSNHAVNEIQSPHLGADASVFRPPKLLTAQKSMPQIAIAIKSEISCEFKQQVAIKEMQETQKSQSVMQRKAEALKAKKRLEMSPPEQPPKSVQHIRLALATAEEPHRAPLFKEKQTVGIVADAFVPKRKLSVVEENLRLFGAK